MKKVTLKFFLIISLVSCSKPDVSKRSVEMIVSKSAQDSIFHNLIKVVDNVTLSEAISDSLSFLILPIDASCPSCRKKTIDSILKYKNNLSDRHYIIIAANGGRKIMEGYFKEQGGELPPITDRMILDSTNRSYLLGLCKDRPTMYYAHAQKVYKKVAAIPITVRNDLQEFFSGHRN